jgi:hypothetical protein
MSTEARPAEPQVILASDSDLFRRTWRTVLVLVTACVLFVGTLSAVAVFIASKAVSGSSPKAAEVKTADKPPVSI